MGQLGVSDSIVWLGIGSGRRAIVIGVRGFVGLYALIPTPAASTSGTPGFAGFFDDGKGGAGETVGPFGRRTAHGREDFFGHVGVGRACLVGFPGLFFCLVRRSFRRGAREIMTGCPRVNRSVQLVVPLQFSLSFLPGLGDPRDEFDEAVSVISGRYGRD